MKATLEFDLNEQDDVYAHKRCVKALDLALVLFEYEQYLRERLKYSASSSEVHAELEKAQGRFYMILDQHSVSTGDLLY